MLRRSHLSGVVCGSICIVTLLLILGINVALIADEQSNDYFPQMIGSFWVYEDQDGNELTRRVVAEKTIEDETYHAFSYEPTLKDWADHDYHIHPHLYQVGEEWVTFSVADNVKKRSRHVLQRRASTTMGYGTTERAYYYGMR